jgi:hypothetical protein
MSDHRVPKQITTECPGSSLTQIFILTRKESARNFLDIFLFRGHTFPGNDRLIRATRRAFWTLGHDSGLRRDRLNELRHLPKRIVDSLRAVDRQTCFSLAKFLLDLVEIEAEEFKDPDFWGVWEVGGKSLVLFGRRELEEMEKQLIELRPRFNAADDDEICGARVAIDEVLSTLRGPEFCRFVRAMPSSPSTRRITDCRIQTNNGVHILWRCPACGEQNDTSISALVSRQEATCSGGCLCEFSEEVFRQAVALRSNQLLDSARIRAAAGGSGLGIPDC